MRQKQSTQCNADTQDGAWLWAAATPNSVEVACKLASGPMSNVPGPGWAPLPVSAPSKPVAEVEVWLRVGAKGSRADVATDQQSLLLTAQCPVDGFHFLRPGSYMVQIVLRGEGEEHSQSMAALSRVTELNECSGSSASSQTQQLFPVRVPPLRGFFGLPVNIAQQLLFPVHHLGSWLLRCEGNYAYILSADIASPGFLEQLLSHGLFVLPGPGPLAACPLPVRPYVLDLTGLPRDRWGRSKKLRRHNSSFWLTVNSDFKKHLLACAAYHETRGGTWITPKLVDQLWELHESASSQVRTWCFELWDRASGALTAASFGLSIGTFFHDFSMCTLVKDDRSCGAVLSKCIGELLARCGMAFWYWGVKCPYMGEYDAFGGREIPRCEYYSAVRAAIAVAPNMEPSSAEALADALVKSRPSCS